MQMVLKIDREQLADAVEKSKSSGGLSNRLASMAMQIARSYLADLPESQHDDIMSDWSLRFVKNWSKIDPNSNPMAYIVYTVRQSKYCYFRSQKRRIDREQKKASQDYVSAQDRVQKFFRTRL